MEKNNVNFKQFLIESINNFLEQYKRKSDIAYFIDKTVLYCKSYLNAFDDSFINKHGNYIDKNLLYKDHGYVNYISLPKNINKQFTSELVDIISNHYHEKPFDFLSESNMHSLLSDNKGHIITDEFGIIGSENISYMHKYKIFSGGCIGDIYFYTKHNKAYLVFYKHHPLYNQLHDIPVSYETFKNEFPYNAIYDFIVPQLKIAYKNGIDMLNIPKELCLMFMDKDEYSIFDDKYNSSIEDIGINYIYNKVLDGKKEQLVAYDYKVEKDDIKFMELFDFKSLTRIINLVCDNHIGTIISEIINDKYKLGFKESSEFNRILWLEDKEKSITIIFKPEYYAYKGAFPYGYLKKYNICVTIDLPDNKKEYIRGKITDFTTPEQLEKQFTSSFKGKNYDLLSKEEIDYYRNNSFKKEDYDIIYDYLKLKLSDQKNEIKKVRKQ